MTIERRKHPRFNLVHEVIYCDSASPRELANEGRSQTKDVSKGGLRVRLSNPLDRKKDLDLTIINKTSGEKIHASAKLVWDKTADDGLEAGLRFVKIGWTESDKLLSV